MEFIVENWYVIVTGIVFIVGGKWIHFDYVPGEPDIREGGAMVTGRICVIGSKLNEQAVAELFGTAH